MVQLKQDTKQYLTLTVLILLDAYRIITGSLLAVFVPQDCSDVEEELSLNGTTRICTVEENVNPEKLTDFNHAVVIFNYITALCFIGVYYWEAKRERFMVANFDDEDSKPTDWLVHHGPKDQPVIWAQYMYLQMVYYRLVLSLMVVFIVNCVLSGVLVFAIYFLDGKTVTSFLTSMILLAQKLSHMRTVSLAKVPRSSYLIENVAFNEWDPDIRQTTAGPAPVEVVPPTPSAQIAEAAVAAAVSATAAAVATTVLRRDSVDVSHVNVIA